MAVIGIVGHGYVGKAVEYGFKPKNKVLVYDKYFPSKNLPEVVEKSEFIFICVPTPMDKKYEKIDLSIVEEVVKNVVGLAQEKGREPVLIIKSTVVPGATRTLGKKYHWPQILFNPEFLTEANYLDDFVNSDRIVIGGDNNDVLQQLVSLYRESFPKTPIFQTDPTTAEMVKYMANAFLATKVIFANELFDLCQELGIKYEEVKKMVTADHRIFDSHLDITTQRGFGGKCFPKDIVALLGSAREKGVLTELLEAAWKKNLRIRKIRDWEEIPGAVSN